MELEITESIAMARQHDAIDQLHRLVAAGVGLTLGDFGTVHSSLMQLQRLPVSKLMISPDLVRDIPQDAGASMIARTVIAMGHTMGLKVLAKGVETEEGKEFLIKENCDQIQGQLLSKLLSADDFERLLIDGQ